MRILHILASADRRGAEVFGVELAARLDQRGHGDEVIALAGAAGTAAGLDVEVLPALGSPSAARALRRRAGAADVVLGHGSRGLVAGTLATWGTATPLVYRSIGDPGYWGASAARRIRVGLQLRRAAAVTALWEGAADAIVRQYGVAPDRVVVVPNAADPERFAPADAGRRRAARSALGLSADGPVALYVGALAPEKRVEAVIDAVAQVAGAALVIAGDGPRRDEVAARAAQVLAGRAVSLGAVADVTTVYDAADVVVLLSRTEGQPGVAIEAGLCALPVVATDVGGVPAVVLDGRTGRLVAPEAPTAAVAAAIDDAIHRGAALGAAAREHCRQSFSFDAVAARFEVVLTDALDRRDGAAP